MSAIQQDTWSYEDEQVPSVSLDDARAHDAFWARVHSQENYFRAGLDYEDYAAAYCAGYVGHAQYGGSFDDAEKSILSNWVRMKGDSRLSVDEAQMAMRAAWDRSAAVAQGVAEEAPVQPAGLFVRRLAGMLEAANNWLDDVEDRLAGVQPRARPLARRAQQGGFVRH